MPPKYREAPKSEMDSQRELLDSLMGINRNNDRVEDQVSDYRDERVCKFFLLGTCPNDLFVNTKMDEGPCRNIHSDSLKADFEKNARDPHMFDSVIERDFSNRIAEADRVIKRARARVEEEKADETINPEINPDILRCHAEMSRIISNAEAAGLDGDIDTVMELVNGTLEDLTREKTATLNIILERKRARPGGPDKKLRVCDVCGSMLSIFDSDKRLTDHFLGKQHIGYQFLREQLEAVRVRKETRYEYHPGHRCFRFTDHFLYFFAGVLL
jgi:RNA-binding protein Luc7-like 2